MKHQEKEAKLTALRDRIRSLIQKQRRRSDLLDRGIRKLIRKVGKLTEVEES